MAIQKSKASENKVKVCITGATGVMGFATLKEFMKYPDEFNVRLLVRDSKKSRKKLFPFMQLPNVEIVWGDLVNAQDVEKAVEGCQYVLHIGGMVSPLADHYPETTMKVNVEGARNVVNAVKNRVDRDEVRLVYIGSVAETAHRHEPHHWGRTGDPIMAALYDNYAISKIRAELEFAESGLKRWVSLRQSGILHKGLIFKGTDPISFHVPLRGVLEWATVEDSARLMVGVCRKEVPESFWRKFYNIGSGESFRLTNYEFELLLLKSLGCPPPEKCFSPGWFATRNFHGEWYIDSDTLNSIIPFREPIDAREYFARMSKDMPWWMNLTPLAPACLIKGGMWSISRFKSLGTLNWIANNKADRIEAFFGKNAEQSLIRKWAEFDSSRPSDVPVLLNHGYDESIPESEIDLGQVAEAGKYRGLKCLSPSMTTGDLDTELKWQCHCGNKFSMRPRTILYGGHWCPKCETTPEKYEEAARWNPFMAAVWRDSHKKPE